MRRFVVALLLAAFAGALARPALAAVNVERTGSENPMVEVARSTMYGALAGTLVGTAIWAAQQKNAEPVRWGFVIGTFVGLGYGIEHVATRPQASLLESRDGRLASGGLAALDLAPGAVRVRAIGVRF